MVTAEFSTGSFCDLTMGELLAVDGGRWTWQNTADVAVAVGCVVIGCTGPAGVVIGSIISIGYAVGRGL